MCHKLQNEIHNQDRQFVSIRSRQFLRPKKARSFEIFRWFTLTCFSLLLLELEPPNTKTSPFNVAEQDA